MPLVTIGIPVYNEERFLEKTILAAINQTFSDLEIVISDNASTDGSAEIIKKYQRIDNRIKPILKATNEGPGANFSTLVAHTKSKYFVLLGAHDIFLPDYIEKAVTFLESNPDYVMAYPHSNFIDADDNHTGCCDSDIDTSGLDVSRRMKKVAEDLSWCTCVHGVFRSEVVRKIPNMKIRGGDQLMLFAAAYYGHLRFLDGLGILRREWRGDASEVIEQRRIQLGMYEETGSRLFDAYAVMSMEHLRFLFNKTTLSLYKKILLSISLLPIFKRGHGTRASSIVFAYLNRQKSVSY